MLMQNRWKAILDALLRTQDALRTGAIIACGNAVLEGYLECDGSERAKAQYPALAAYLGNTWGAPSSPANFVLPDITPTASEKWIIKT